MSRMIAAITQFLRGPGLVLLALLWTAHVWAAENPELEVIDNSFLHAGEKLESEESHSLPTLRLDASQEMISTAQRLWVLEDAGHTLTLGSLPPVQDKKVWHQVQHTSGNTNLGYSKSSFWFALPVDVTSDAPQKWLLEVAFGSLDLVEVYSPDEQGRYHIQISGDIYPFAARPYPHRHMVFPLSLTPGKHMVYIKVRSEGTLTMPINLWPIEALHAHDQQAYSLLSLYYGALLALFFYNFLIYLSTRETVFLFYVAFVGSMIIAQASLNGIGNQFLWPEWPAWGNLALPCGMAATGLFGALFSRQFLNTRSNFPRLDKIIQVFAVWFGLVFLSPLVFSYQVAAITVSVTGVIFSLFVTLVAVSSYVRRNPGAFYFLLAWGAVLSGVLVLGLRNLGWIQTNPFTIYSMQIGSAIEMLMLSFALADRITIMRKEKEQAQRDTLNAKQELVDTLIKSEQELEERVALRTKEIEAVNTQLRHKERELRYMALHDSLTGLANRTLMNDSLKRAIARADRDLTVVAVLLIDLDGFKEVNDSYGHAAGDLVLQVVAARLRKITRISDVTARLGGDEFVVVLEDIHGIEDAVRIAEKLVKELSRPVEGGLHVSASVGIALTGSEPVTADALLKKADKAMYEAKMAGSNRWHVAPRQ